MSARKAPTQRPQLQFVITLAVATIMLFMGGVLVLMSVGLVTPDEPVGPGARIVAFLFGGTLAWLGGRGGGLMLLALAEADGARDWLSALRLGAARLVRRAGVQSVIAAATLVPLVVGYWREVTGGSWIGPSRETLIGLVPIEFLLIHGFPFLAFAASIARIPGFWPRWGGWAAVVGFLLLYSAFAWGVMDGPWGVAALLYLSLPNVLAFAHKEQDWTVRTTAVARWATKILTLVAVMMLLNEHGFDDPGVLTVGLIYFAIQTVAELFRVAELPLDMASAWTRLSEERRAKATILGTST